MRILKIVFNNGMNEGYFIEKRRGYIQVTIKEGEVFNLKNIKSKKEVRVNEATLKVEEVTGDNGYIN